MNGEQISDSLIYLDDDLIAETDAVRQGKRIPFRMPARGILAAACAALLLAGALALPQRMVLPNTCTPAWTCPMPLQTVLGNPNLAGLLRLPATGIP